MTEPIAPHSFLCPLRWSDMDAAGHVHDVLFLRYLEEARIDMFYSVAERRRQRGIRGGTVLAALAIDYLRPLRYRPAPVRIESAVERVGTKSYSLTQRMVDGDTVHARVSTTLVAFDLAANRSRELGEDERAYLSGLRGDLPGAAGHDAGPVDGPVKAHRYDLQVRRADMDAFSHVNNVVYLTYVDEAREDMLAGALGGGDVTERLVVARHRVSYLRPLVHRRAPVHIDSAVTRVGRSSFGVRHEVRDDDATYCTVDSVLVAFDPATERARPLTDAERAALAGLS